MSHLEMFQSFLHEMFRSGSADLEFGIFRILNYKRNLIENFIEHEIPRIVDDAFVEFASEAKSQAEKELQSVRTQIVQVLGTNAIDADSSLKPEFHQTPLGKQYTEAKSRVLESKLTDELKSSVYNDLLTFFSRYYDRGDFVSKRRYGRSSPYIIPYSGEETLLSWANKDQYYIKTSDRHLAYIFTAGNATVVLQLQSLTEANQSIGRQRFSVLVDHEFIKWESSSNTLSVSFELRSLAKSEQKQLGKKSRQQTQEALSDAAHNAILSSIPDGSLKSLLGTSPVNGVPSLLMKHLLRFTRKYTADFFVHKDLNDFMKRELEYFIKNQVLLLDELIGSNETVTLQQIARARVLRQVGGAIVDFLSQVENFQKYLFEKKKFVLQTDYCMTLDKVPEDLYSEVGANKGQVEEWRNLFRLDETTRGTLFPTQEKDVLDVEFLKTHSFLVLDTKFFSSDFKERLLGFFQNIDDEIGGILIKSENYHALNLLRERWGGRVDCIYIDPPYNTGRDDFLFKDNYRHSSWLTMMSDRLRLARAFLKRDGIAMVSIDDHELYELRMLMNDIFGSDAFVTNFVWNTEGHTDNQFQVKINHEYILTYSLDQNEVELGYVIDPNTRENSNLWKGFAENSITKNGKGNPPSEVLLPKGFPCKIETLDLEPSGLPPEFFQEINELSYISREITKKYQASYPVRMDPLIVRNSVLAEPCRVYSGWANVNKLRNYIEEGFRPLVEEDGETRFFLSKGGVIYYRKDRTKARHILSVLRNMGTTEKMSSELEHMGLAYSYPKPKELIKHLLKVGAAKSGVVLDFFAGSGTTGQAILELNMDENYECKYILVDMSEHFSTVLKPRIQKVMYSREWRDGIPTSNTGISHIFKYHTLEQYEDVMLNIDFPRADEGQLTLETFGDNYFLNYMIRFETQGSTGLIDLAAMKQPFDYKLKIQEEGEVRGIPVDFIETFNYLLGLHVRKRRAYTHNGCHYIAIAGEKDEDQFVVVWRSSSHLENDPEVFLADKEFIVDTIIPDLLGATETPDRLIVNGLSAIEMAESIEPEFTRLMFGETW